MARSSARDARYTAAWLAVALVALALAVASQYYAPRRDAVKSLSYEASILGDVRVGVGLPLAPGAHSLHVLAYRVRHFDPESGPSDDPLEHVVVEGTLPLDYEVFAREGMPVWLVVVLDEDGSGLEAGPAAGDLVGWSERPFQSPAESVDLVLTARNPWTAGATP